jgi:transglutaminase-like putative cysteine protease
MNPARPLTASLPARRGPRPGPAVSRASAPLLPVPLARLLAFAALASFGALQWGRLVAPGAGGAMVATLLAALAAGAGLAAVARARWSTRRRWTAGLLAAAALLLVALLAAGVPVRLFGPHGWDDLVRGIGDGLGAVPTITVPYAGAEEWTRNVIVLGGVALIGLAALLAFLPRRDGRFGYPLAAAVALGALYATPIIQRHAVAPFASGLAFALLLALFLWLERVERRSWGLAAALVVATAFAGLVAAPRLDGTALLDYEQLAQSLSPAVSTTYTWNHTYGPLDWPRDGREVLRVRSPQRAYWKAVNLNVFDGRGWVQDSGPLSTSRPDVARLRAAWIENVRVTVRALRSQEYVAAGTTLAILGDDRVRSTLRGGPPVPPDGLARGETYRAAVYVPRPTTKQLAAAGTAYPDALHADYGFLRVPFDLPGAPNDQQVVPIPFWGAPADAQQPDVEAAVSGSPYAGVYALAQRLRAQSSSPYDYMRAIERYLARGFSYSETPPPSRTPLADFLLRDKVGYCQQFSGAMALLLRMGGVPARVSAGFAPGVLDDKTKEYIVRDLDAHSWVEVYFPGIGWVTRDPTPSASPARSQTADLAAQKQSSDVTIGGAGKPALGGPADRGGAAAPAAARDKGGSSHTPLAIAAVVLVIALALAGVALALRRRVRRRRAAASGEPEDELAELRRALRRSGRAPHPELTLELLAGRFAGTAAESYVRTLGAARFGYASQRPTREQRAALRRELGAGLGLRGRLRAWWALPPSAPLGRRSRTT